MRELVGQAVIKILGIPLFTVDEWAEMSVLSEEDKKQEKPKKFSELFPKAVNIDAGE